MIHVANSVARCSAMIDIMDIMTGDACVLGYVVGFMTGRPGVSTRAVITRRPTVFCHATMIIAVIMSAGRGTSGASVAAMIIIPGSATTTTTTTTTTTAVAATTAAMVGHGALDVPCMRRAIEPPGNRSHRQSKRAYRQSNQQ